MKTNSTEPFMRLVSEMTADIPLTPPSDDPTLLATSGGKTLYEAVYGHRRLATFGVCGHEAVAPSAIPSAPSVASSSSDLASVLRTRFPGATVVSETDYASAQVGDVVYSLTSANGVTVASRYELCMVESISGSTGQDALDALLKPMKE